MSEYQGSLQRRVPDGPSLEPVQVGATNPHRLDLQQDLTGSGFRDSRLIDHQLAGAMEA